MAKAMVPMISMKKKNRVKAWIIFGLYIAATCALLLKGYSVQKPAVQQREFPFSITYTYQGKTETISDTYVAECIRTAKYIGDAPIAWVGYIKDRDRLEADFYRIGQSDDHAFSINLNIAPGYLMGDPLYAASDCQPAAVAHGTGDNNDTVVSDTNELERMGFIIDSWEYPVPIENSFSFACKLIIEA